MAEKLTRMTAEQSRAWISLITTAELLPAALDAQLRKGGQRSRSTQCRGPPHS
jgi:hypothetical protein